MVSTETGHKSKKKREKAGNTTKIRRNKNQETYLNTHYDLPRSVFEGRSRKAVTPDDHVYDVVRSRDDTYENVEHQNSSLYQNVDGIYDRPRGATFVQSHYENLTFEEDHTYLNVQSKRKSDNSERCTYDIPRSSVAIYDHPIPLNGTDPSGDNTYDFPKSLIPLSARLLLNARNRGAVTGTMKDNSQGECDTDSLDGDRESASEYHQNADDHTSDRRCGSSPDEGIGELDVKGLDVIVEEAEEENYPNLVYAENVALREIGQRLLKSKKKTGDASKKMRSTFAIEKPAQNAINESSLSELDSSSVASASTEEDSSQSKDITNKESSNDTHDETSEEAEKNQKDRSIDVYHETMRQRNNKAKGKPRDMSTFHVTSAKEGSDNFSTIRRMKKLLPSVKALRSQFEPRVTDTNRRTSGDLSTSVRKWKSSSSFKETTEIESNRSRSSSLGSLDEISSTSSSSSTKIRNILMDSQPFPTNAAITLSGSNVPIIEEFQVMSKSENDLYKPRHLTAQWDPTALLEELYKIEEPLMDKGSEKDENNCTNIEGFLEKLPSGRRKATFWNAWKSRYFRLKDGCLYYFQTNVSEKPNTIFQLSGGIVENMDNNMIGIDDGRGHYMVVRGNSKQETERWYQALLTHVNHNARNNYIQPSPIIHDPSLLKPVIIIDLGSSSVRAGIVSSQATLPKVFFPSTVAMDKISGSIAAVGLQSLLPEVRMTSTLTYPIRSSNKMSKLLDIQAVTGLVRSAIQQLNVDPSNYAVQVNVPRHFNAETQAEIQRILFDTFGVKAVNLTHQSVLCLMSYNATSGIVVDIGERIDIVPIMDGYILESSVSHVPYGGQQLMDHLRHFLVQQRYSLITDVESYLIRYVLEKLAYVAGPDMGGYPGELNKARKDPSSVRGTVDLRSFSNGHLPWDSISLELGRFQVTEGLFSPEAWGLDNSGIQTLINKAIQECSVDIRKEMTRSIYLGGGITMLPGFPERLETEIAKLVPTHLTPKVHASPYRYHASYLGACALCNSPAFEQSKITREEWNVKSDKAMPKWKN